VPDGYWHWLRAYPAMEPTAQHNGHMCATCGPATGFPSAKPKLGASYLKFGLVWHHSQADPTRAAFPTGHPVVSSKTPEASAKTHTHNWCGRQRQATNTTQRCEAQRLLASLGGSGTALLSRSDIPTGPLPSTLRGTLASGPKTGVKRGPHPPPGVCPRPNQNMPTKSPRRG